MSLVKSSLLNAIAMVVKVGAGLALNKVLAIFVGPSGYALIGQFQNLVNMGTTFASAGVSNGVTKYTAEHAADVTTRRRYWRAAMLLSTGCVAVIAVAIIVFRVPLARYLLKDTGYSNVLVWFAVLLVFLVWNALLLAVLNGLKALHQYVAINILGSLIGFLVAALMVVLFGIKGALISLVVSQAVVFVAAVSICRRAEWFQLSNFWGRTDRQAVHALARFALMALVTAIVVPGSQIVIREHLGTQFGWTVTGYWQAMTKISDVYLLIITMTLSYYYLPLLAELRSGDALRREVWTAYKYLIPLACVLALPIYLLRDFVTAVLFTKDFSPMRDLFFWQLIGDVIKICSWLLAYLMVAKAMTVEYIASEIIFSATLVGLTMWCTAKMGIQGAVFAFALNYFGYWIVMFFICRKHFNHQQA